MILGYNNLYIFWGAAQIIFVSITLFGIILGITTVFSYSKEDRNFYYPTWKPAVGFYIVHSFEIIYVLCYLSIPSMQFVSAMGMLLPISLAFLCWPRYFFFKKTPRSIILLALLPFLVLIPMFINLIWPDLLPSFIVSNIPYLLCLLFLISSIAFIIYQYDCHKKQIKEYEMEYSSLSDFPKNFANQMCIVLFLWVGLHLLIFICQSHMLKAWIDILRSAFVIGITILWMGENRSKKESSPLLNQEFQGTNTIIDHGDNKLLAALHRLMREEQLYLNPELRLSDLQARLFTNRTYLSKAINSVEGQTFYSIVLKYRMEYVIDLLLSEPESKLDDLAFRAGFSSRSYFSRTFKAETGMTPSEYRRNKLSEAI